MAVQTEQPTLTQQLDQLLASVIAALREMGVNEDVIKSMVPPSMFPKTGVAKLGPVDQQEVRARGRQIAEQTLAEVAPAHVSEMVRAAEIHATSVVGVTTAADADSDFAESVKDMLVAASLLGAAGQMIAKSAQRLSDAFTSPVGNDGGSLEGASEEAGLSLMLPLPPIGGRN